MILIAVFSYFLKKVLTILKSFFILFEATTKQKFSIVFIFTFLYCSIYLSLIFQLEFVSEAFDV